MREEIILKTSIDIARMRKPARILEKLFRELKHLMEAGITTGEIAGFCETRIKESGAASAQKGYQGFPASVSISPNNVATHGIPGSTRLVSGDVVTVDVALELGGWYSDGAWTYCLGHPGPDTLRLVKAAWRSMRSGILALKAGRRLGDVGSAITASARRFGCGILDDFAGHGIGESMHEDPIVANCGTKGVGQPIVPGMVLTIEPIVCLGKPATRLLEDGWTVVTQDGMPTAQYEHTLAVLRDSTEILTLGEAARMENLDLPPFF